MKEDMPTNEICRVCVHSNNIGRDGCYCILYGIIIGYSKHECRGFKREQVPEQEDDC